MSTLPGIIFFITCFILGNTRKEQIDIELLAMEYAARMLKWSEPSTLAVITKVCENHGISTLALPKYTRDVKITFSAKDLLKQNKFGISSMAFNKLMIAIGYMAEKTRTGNHGKIKKYKALTDAGLNYGQNDVSPHNPRETQAHYFADTFAELFNKINA